MRWDLVIGLGVAEEAPHWDNDNPESGEKSTSRGYKSIRIRKSSLLPAMASWGARRGANKLSAVLISGRWSAGSKGLTATPPVFFALLPDSSVPDDDEPEVGLGSTRSPSKFVHKITILPPEGSPIGRKDRLNRKHPSYPESYFTTNSFPPRFPRFP